MNTLLDKGRAGAPLGITPCIDMHGHIGRYMFAVPDIRPESLIETMDRIGVQTIFISHITCLNYEVRWGNDVVADVRRACPGRFEGYIALWPDSQESVRTEVARCLASGFGGIKLHKPDMARYADAAYRPAWEAAQERRLPVLLHTWGDEPVMSDVKSLAGEYPDANIILGHSGATNVEKYIALANNCPHIYLDLALSAGPRGLVERFVASVPPDKILYGSDASFMSMCQQVGKVLGARISEEMKLRILGQNAASVLARRRLESAHGS